jgi:dTDP-4-dehydrorhamnose 3,5-epimerase-like enzyme
MRRSDTQKMIEGIELRQLKKNVDERGYLCEILRKDWGFFKDFAMTYFSITFPGVVRGWHRHPVAKQTDYMCVLQVQPKWYARAQNLDPRRLQV